MHQFLVFLHSAFGHFALYHWSTVDSAIYSGHFSEFGQAEMAGLVEWVVYSCFKSSAARNMQSFVVAIVIF